MRRGFFWSFAHAGRGVWEMLRTERNARIHAVVTLVVIGAGWACGLDRLEWAAVALACGLVWGAEALNTAVEGLVDMVSPEHLPAAGRVKDLAAGGVLLATGAACAVGVLVFGPRLSP